jgi:hypothetical protein
VGRRWRTVLTLAVVAVVVAPAFWPGVEDDFPISTYPMFTAERDREVELDTAVLAVGGERGRLTPQEIGGTDEVVLAAETVTGAVRRGEADALCAEIAGRVGGPGEVQLVTETHDAVDLVRDGGPPESVTVHARCPA